MEWHVELAVLKGGGEGHFAATNKARGSMLRKCRSFFKEKNLHEKRVEKMKAVVGPWRHYS